MLTIKLIFIITVLFKITLCDQMLVSTAQGKVLGYKNDETGLFEFYGIPYATPPTGEDKFKAPLPPEHRNYTLEANNYNIYCPQNEETLPGLYQEDCLVINIFVPDGNVTNYPVVAYVHGGAFVEGYSNFLLPEYLAQTGIIAVTFNYRLGAHGFLCLQTESAPGNAGLRDQLAALRWIKENISNFGGNTDDITLAGYSAGAATAEILMLSPTNTNLFHKIILESGSGVASFALKEDPIEFAKEFAKHLGASSTQVANIQSLEQFYLSLSFEKMFQNVNMTDGLHVGFCPCVEKKISGVETIIAANPLDILRTGSYSKLPLLTGYTNGEGLLFYENKEVWLQGMSTNMQPYFPPNYHLKATEKEKDVAEQIRETYFPNGFQHENVNQNFVDYFTDSVFMFWILLSARLHADHSENVFLYEFTYSGTLDAFYHPEHGAGHCAQTAYVLQQSQENNLNETDKIVRNKIVKLWSNFIKNGEPTTTNDTQTFWKKLDSKNMNYMKIDTELAEGTWARKKYMDFWDSVWSKKWNEKDGANQVLPAFITTIISSCIIIYYNKT